MRLVAALTPIIVVVGLMTAGFMLLLSERRIMRESGRNRPATIGPVSPSLDHGGAAIVQYRQQVTFSETGGMRWRD